MKLKPAKRFGHRYPWDDWLALIEERPLTLLRGREFSIQPYAMVQLTYRAARMRGLLVSVSLEGDQLTIKPREGDE